VADPHNLNNTTHKQKVKKTNYSHRNQSTNIPESFIIHPSFLGIMFSTASRGVHTNLNRDIKKDHILEVW
jgi:hypothetical protein